MRSAPIEILTEPPREVRLDSSDTQGNIEALAIVTDVDGFCDHGNYASEDNPPCMPNGDSRCITLTAYLPLNANILAIRLYCREHGSGHWLLSPANSGAPVGWARFTQVWQSTSPRNKLVNVEFKNWSHDRGRDARIEVEWT